MKLDERTLSYLVRISWIELSNLAIFIRNAGFPDIWSCSSCKFVVRRHLLKKLQVNLPSLTM